jgi:DNA polymerase III delta subunit
VQAGQVPPLALLHGPDVQALDDALAAVTRVLFTDDTMASLGREVLDARDTPPSAIVLAAQTMPFGVPIRLVAVRHCQALAAKDAEPLRDYVRRPSPSTCLLLLADDSLLEQRDKKRHWLLDAVPSATIVELPVRKGRALQDWLRQRGAAEGYTVSEEAARLLVQWTGDDAVSVMAEMRKAALAGGPENMTVGTKEVAAVVGEHRVNDVFDLTRAVEQRDMATALVTLDRLLATEQPMLLIALLTRGVRQALMVREWVRRGVTPDQIARNLRLPPRVAEAIVARTRSGGERLPQQLQRCWEVERRLKSSGEPRAELTALVAELCAGA